MRQVKGDARVTFAFQLPDAVLVNERELSSTPATFIWL